MLLWTSTLTKALKEQSNQVLRFLTPILENWILFFRDSSCSCFCLAGFPLCRCHTDKEMRAGWLDGEQRGQCYSPARLPHTLDYQWARYCRGVGKEWQHHTLLERNEEQLAVLEDSHICIKYRPASYYWANIYCKAKGALQTTKKYASFLTYRGKNWLKLTVERKRGRGGYVYCGGREWKERVDETRSQMFSMKTLIWDALPKVWRRSGEKQAEWICNRNAFQLFTRGPSKALLGQMLKCCCTHFCFSDDLKSLCNEPRRGRSRETKNDGINQTQRRVGWGGGMALNSQNPKKEKKGRKKKGSRQYPLPSKLGQSN